jgi:FMN phosphatase YigB (HAD superfamily)/carbamoylphosphate synthase large subunit
MKTALIVSGGGFQGLGLLQALQQLDDTRIIVCDIFPENITRYLCADYVLAPPLHKHEEFRSFLLNLAKREKVDVIFPATARELVVLSQLKEDLAKSGTLTAVSEEPLLAILLDKRQAYEWLHVNALPALPLVDPTNFDFAYPLFGRLRDSWGGHGTMVLRRAQDLSTLGAPHSHYIWTRWLADFEEFSADFAIAGPQRISTLVLRRRDRSSGGFAVISTSASDNTLENLAAELARALASAGGLGLFNTQFVVPPGGDPVISDINPRIGTSATHALAEGINLSGFLMRAMQGADDPAPQQPRKKVRTVRLLNDLVIPEIQRPNGIIFDLDDTLVDHKLWMLKKLEVTYRAFFHQHVESDIFFPVAAALIDEGVRADLIDRLLLELKLPTAFREEAIDAYRAAVVPDTPLFSDVIPTLQALKSAGLPLAILTDNPPATQKSKIAHSSLENYFDKIIYSRDHGPEKPHAGAFLQASRELSVDLQQLVMVGDNYFRDGVGAMQAGYLHALIVRRQGAFLNHHKGLAEKLHFAHAARIDMVDTLLSVFHACTGT